MSKQKKLKQTALPLANLADARRLGYVGRKPSSEKRDSDSWFTPPEYLDSVRAVLDEIDLDPFTSERANEIVGAKWIFTSEQSAFENDWRVDRRVHVFMNPPYSAGLCKRAVLRFIEQYEAKRFEEGIVLVNNATDTKWFSALVAHCDGVCFTNHRISFWNADRKNVSGNTRGQAFFYFGGNLAKFRHAFKKHGFVLVPAN